MRRRELETMLRCSEERAEFWERRALAAEKAPTRLLFQVEQVRADQVKEGDMVWTHGAFRPVSGVNEHDWIEFESEEKYATMATPDTLLLRQAAPVSLPEVTSDMIARAVRVRYEARRGPLDASWDKLPPGFARGLVANSGDVRDMLTAALAQENTGEELQSTPNTSKSLEETAQREESS
jgi:hypothetical protein